MKAQAERARQGSLGLGLGSDGSGLQPGVIGVAPLGGLDVQAPSAAHYAKFTSSATAVAHM